MQLKAIIKLQQRQKSRTSHTTQSIVSLCKKEQGRRAKENEALRVFSAKVVGSPQLSKAFQQLHRKIEQIAMTTQNFQLALLQDVNADSYAHCEQIMEEEIDYLDRSGAILAQFSALGSVIALQNQQILQSTQKLIQQLRQRFNSVVAVSESRREAAQFFGDPDIQTTLAKLQGESLNPRADRFDRDVSLPLVIKTSFYDKMMLHNKHIAIELKAIYAKRKQKTQLERPRTQQAQSNSELKQFKGLQTLKMLEKQLGLEETKLEELNPFTRRNQIFDDTNQSFYSMNQFLATSDNFQAQKPHNYVYSIQEQYMRQLEDQYKFLQSTKQAKMLQVVNVCRRIQRFWRRHKQARRIKSAIIIQRFFRYRQLLQRKKWVQSRKQSKLGRLRRMMAGLKIKRWLVSKFRGMRQKPKMVKYPQTHIKNLIRVQAVFRGHLVRKSKLWKQVQRERKHIQTTKMFKKYLRLQKPIAVLQSKQISVISESVSRRETLDEYIVKAIAEFEAGWMMHEQQLKKYELTQAKLTDWEERKQEKGTIWLNIKTGEQTTQHPGFKYFKINRKSMRNRAEEKFQRDVISPLEQERERLSIKSEKQVTSLLNDIVCVYKFNVLKIYLH